MTDGQERPLNPRSKHLKYVEVALGESMDEFRIAGSVSGEDEEAVLSSVVRIAGYSMNIHSLVARHFDFCATHAAPLKRRSERRSEQPPVVRRDCAGACAGLP